MKNNVGQASFQTHNMEIHSMSTIFATMACMQAQQIILANSVNVLLWVERLLYLVAQSGIAAVLDTKTRDITNHVKARGHQSVHEIF